MNRDLVKQLTDIWLGEEIDNNGIFIKAAKRIEALEKALREVKELSDRRSTHPMSSEADYFRIARAALEGEDAS